MPLFFVLDKGASPTHPGLRPTTRLEGAVPAAEGELTPGEDQEQRAG